MPLKPLSYRQVKRKLEKAGFTITSQRGSHVKFVRYNSDGTTTVMELRQRLFHVIAKFRLVYCEVFCAKQD